jgi:hypothetical protein
LAELVTEGEHALLGAGALFVAAPAPESRVEATRLQRVEQGPRLQLVAGGAGIILADATRVDRLLHGGDDQLMTGIGDPPVPELDDLREVMAGIDVEHGERQRHGRKRLLGQPQQHDRVLAPAEQQDGALELGHHLAHDVDGLGLQDAQLIEADQLG